MPWLSLCVLCAPCPRCVLDHAWARVVLVCLVLHVPPWHLAPLQGCHCHGPSTNAPAGQCTQNTSPEYRTTHAPPQPTPHHTPRCCAQEELSPPRSGEPPRAYSLGRLIESAYLNLGRIRLVWARLWAAMAAHLTSAACHPDATIAGLAVEHMRGLIQKLLARAELSHFTHQVRAQASKTQEEGFRPQKRKKASGLKNARRLQASKTQEGVCANT